MMLRSCRKIAVLGISCRSGAGCADGWGAPRVKPPRRRCQIDARAPNARRSRGPTPAANIRVDTTLVLIPVTVTDPLNRFVTGLEKETLQGLRGQGRAGDHSLRQRGRAAFGRDRLRHQRQHGQQAAEVAAGGGAVLQDRQPGGRVLPGPVQRRPRTGPCASPRTWRRSRTGSPSRSPRAGRRCWTRIYLALHEMKKARNPRKALLVISDGGDNNSRYTESEIKNLVREADVQIYAIGIYEPIGGARPDGRRRLAGPEPAERDRRADRRAALSGGEPERPAGHRRQDRHRTAQSVRSRLLAAEPGTRRQVPPRAGQSWCSRAACLLCGPSGDWAIMLRLNKTL